MICLLQETAYCHFRQARRDSNPHHPDLESGALPFELLAYRFYSGFRMPVYDHMTLAYPTGAKPDARTKTAITFQTPTTCAFSSPRLPVKLMLTTKAAVFFELESLRGAPLVFRGCVVAAPAFNTRQSNQVSHEYSLRYLQSKSIRVNP